MATKSVVKTKSLAPPSSPGDYFRLLCMTGKNKGLVYYLNSNRVVLGRSEKAHIPVYDQKSSREHCELVKHGKTYVMTDLDSQNGVVINDLKVTQHQLQDGDKIIIGHTVFKFSIMKVLPPALVDEDQEDDEDDEYEDDEVETQSEKKKNDPAKKKKLIYVGVGLLLVLLLFGDGEDSEQEAEEQGSTREGISLEGSSRAVYDDLTGVDPEIQEQVETHIHRGLREFRERNYIRAINEFNLALVLSPNHASASYYLSKTRQRLDEDVETYFFRARREIEALKYSEAVISYCSILRLLESEPSDPRYIEAKESLDLVKDQMGGRGREVRCIEE